MTDAKKTSYSLCLRLTKPWVVVQPHSHDPALLFFDDQALLIINNQVAGISEVYLPTWALLSPGVCFLSVTTTAPARRA